MRFGQVKLVFTSVTLYLAGKSKLKRWISFVGIYVRILNFNF